MFNMDRLPHAMIIQGTNKFQMDDLRDFLSALILCKSELSNSRPCGTCHACKKIKAHSHPDFMLIEGKPSSKSIHVADVRQIISDAYIIPSESDYKLFTIDCADNMTVQAQNALLKILEEPPEGVFLILICKCLDSILGTIRSRTQIFTLSSDVNEEVEISTEAKDYANALLKAVINNDQYEFIVQMAPLIKNKDLTKQVLQKMLINIEAAIRKHYLLYNSDSFDSNNNLIKDLSQKFNIMNLMDYIDVISTTHKQIDLNVNQNLNLNCMCFQLFENN